MFSYPLGTWTLEFPTEYRVVKDDTMAVVLDEERNALVLGSLKPTGTSASRGPITPCSARSTGRNAR